MIQQEQIQITKRNIAEGAVTPPKYIRYMTSTHGKVKGTLVHVIFPPKISGTIDALRFVVHGLRRVPTTWQVLDKGILNGFGARGTVAPGTVYTDTPLPFTNMVAAFRCTVPYTWAKILLT